MMHMLIVDSRKLYHLLVESGLNFADIARKAHISNTTIHRLIDSDRPIQNATAVKLSRVLDVPLEHFILSFQRKSQFAS